MVRENACISSDNRESNRVRASKQVGERRREFSSDGRLYMGQSAGRIRTSVKCAYVPTVNREGTTVGEGV